jgi:hypothetical protein
MSFILPDARTVTVQGRFNKAKFSNVQSPFLKDIISVYTELSKFLLWDLYAG